jgi:hypothetical protein
VAKAREALTRAGFAVRQKYTQRDPRAQPPQVPGTVISQERSASPGGQTTSFIVLDVVATATVLVAYARADEQRTAEDLSVSLRGSINDPQYLIRAGTSRKADTARGQVYYSAPELEPLARRVASDTALWIARKFGRKIDVRPVAFDKVSSTYVILNMPDLEPPR